MLAAWLAIDAARNLSPLLVSRTLPGPAELVVGLAFLFLAWSVLWRPAPAEVRCDPWTLAVVICGVGVPVLYPFLPAREPGDAALAVRIVAAFGFGWCALTLRDSFAVVPERRSIVVRGPYRFVRHPMYACYLLYDATYWFPRGAALTIAVWLAELLLFVARARAEEAVLLAGSPEYQSYSQRVPYRLVPGII